MPIQIALAPIDQLDLCQIMFTARCCLYSAGLRRNGKLRSLFPVAANTAFPIDGANGGTPGSPIPDGRSWLLTKCTSTLGISRIRVGS